jgi:hypothetical protein
MLECILHVRTVEVDNHDPARTPGVVRALIERLHVLYRDAFVAVRAPLGGPRMMTEIVMSQLSEARAIHYNGKVKLLYDANTKDSAKRAMARMNVVVDVVEKRLQADFNQAALESCVEGMFLVEWAEVTTSAARLGVLKQYIRRLFRALRLDPVAGLNAFLDVVPHVVEHGRQVAARDGIDFRDLDFRDIWEIVVLGSLPTVQQQNIELVVPLSDLYSSLEDATGTVERNLGMVRRMLDSHNGPMQPDGSTLSSLVEYALDGPRTEEELFSKGEGGEFLWHPTEGGEGQPNNRPSLPPRSHWGVSRGAWVQTVWGLSLVSNIYIYICKRSLGRGLIYILVVLSAGGDEPLTSSSPTLSRYI